MVEVLEPLQVIGGHPSEVSAVAVSSHGRWIATASGELSAPPDYAVRVWDVSTGELLQRLQHPKQIQWALQPARFGTPSSGDVLVCAGGDGWAPEFADCAVTAWDVSEGRALWIEYGHEDRVRCLAHSEQGGWVASGGDDEQTRIWGEDGRLLRLLQPGDGSITSLLVRSDASLLLEARCTDTFGQIRTWDTGTWALRHSLDRPEGPIEVQVLGSNGQWVAAAGCDAYGGQFPIISVWDLGTGELRYRLGDGESGVYALAASEVQGWLASSGSDGIVRVWDIESGRVVHELIGHQVRVGHLCADPAGRWLVSGDDSGAVRVWDPRTGLPLAVLASQPSRVVSMTLGGERSAVLAVGYWHDTARVWDLAQLHSVAAD